LKNNILVLVGAPAIALVIAMDTNIDIKINTNIHHDDIKQNDKQRNRIGA